MWKHAGRIVNHVWSGGTTLLHGESGNGLDLTASETMPPKEIDSVEDTVTWMGDMINWVKDYAIDVLLPVVIKLAIALAIFLIGKVILRKAVKILKKSLGKSNMEEGTIHFLTSLAHGAGLVVLIAVCANYLNFGTGAIVAVLGSGGLALGLSLQNSLSNFAGGILLLLSKPFVVGDYIIALGNEGVVSKIDVIYTTLLTPDNRKIVLPNGSLSGANIVNVTNQETRRVDITVGVDYASDISYVKSVLEEIAKSQELILKDQDILIFVDSFDSSAITMGIRVWTKSEDYWTVKWDLQEKIKITFDEKDISIPYERMDISFVEEDSHQVQRQKMKK